MKMRTAKIVGSISSTLFMSPYLLAQLAAGLLVGQVVLADTLELRSGQIIQGKFIAGSTKNIRFQVSGQEMTYPIQDVLNIGFSDQGDASTASNTAPQDQPPVPSPQATQAAPGRPATPAPPVAPREEETTPAAGPTAAPQAAPPAPSSPPSSAAPAAAAGPYITIPAGTTVFIRMIDTVDSKQNKIGDTFHASLESALVVGNTVVAPRGADAYGKLTQAKEAGKISGAPELTLELTGIRIK